MNVSLQRNKPTIGLLRLSNSQSQKCETQKGNHKDLIRIVMGLREKGEEGNNLGFRSY